MWRIIRRFLGRETPNAAEPTPQTAQRISPPETTLLYLRIPARQPTPALAPDIEVVHVRDAAAIRNATGSVPSATRLSHPADLPTAQRRADSQPSARDQAASRKRARRQRAIRFAKHFPDMNPLEARVLMAIHRRSPGALARESAGVLKRDWERFLLSTRGQRIAAKTGVPDIARIRRWISLAQTKQAAIAEVKPAAATRDRPLPDAAETPPRGGQL